VTVVVFDSLGGHQAEIRGRLRCTWRRDCQIGASRLGRGARRTTVALITSVYGARDAARYLIAVHGTASCGKLRSGHPHRRI
jgi:hypothetical protein